MALMRRSLRYKLRAGARVALLLCLAVLAGAGLAPAGAQDDTTPPVFQSLAASPATVAPGGTVTLTARITDAGTGVIQAGAVYINPAGGSPLPVFLARVSGTPQDAVFQGTVTVPPLAPSGT